MKRGKIYKYVSMNGKTVDINSLDSEQINRVIEHLEKEGYVCGLTVSKLGRKLITCIEGSQSSENTQDNQQG